MSKQVKRSFVHNQITLQDKIDIIKECRKTLYDYRRKYIPLLSGFKRGVIRAEALLFEKQKRLQKKLKK